MNHDDLVKLTQKLIDEGKLIEAGWQGLQHMAIPRDAPQKQLVEMRKAFFAGAHHVFASIMATLDPGSEPTDADLKRLANITAELDAYIAVVLGQTAGRRQ